MLINMVSVLLFFNISFVAIIGYSQALKVDFQRLVAIQQAERLFLLFMGKCHSTLLITLK
ncbi:hypothetical protein KJX11_15425 [Proteus mirabilis]|uniref:hypothetical protein n=1 Tax=Proteus mirabilis TaxID=584 RepID=UPI00398AE34B